MAGSIRRVAAHLFLAGSACALAFAAAAQDAQNQVQVALERATRTPLEIVWLQTELEAETWQLDRLLTAAPRGCARPGAPKEGCTVSERPVWRYVFGEHTPTESARLVISSRLPDAPFRTGRLSLTGTGRVFIVTPRADGPRTSRPPAGAVVLAAGSTVQLVDAAYPAIQIEVRAPLEEPLLLGNLVSADIATVLGLLVRQPGTVQAASARGVPGGRIALRSSDAELQLASAAAAPRQQPAIAAQRERRAPPTMTAALDGSTFPAPRARARPGSAAVTPARARGSRSRGSGRRQARSSSPIPRPERRTRHRRRRRFRSSPRRWKRAASAPTARRWSSPPLRRSTRPVCRELSSAPLPKLSLRPPMCAGTSLCRRPN